MIVRVFLWVQGFTLQNSQSFSAVYRGLPEKLQNFPASKHEKG